MHHLLHPLESIDLTGTATKIKNALKSTSKNLEKSTESLEKDMQIVDKAVDKATKDMAKSWKDNYFKKVATELGDQLSLNANVLAETIRSC